MDKVDRYLLLHKVLPPLIPKVCTNTRGNSLEDLCMSCDMTDIPSKILEHAVPPLW